MRSLVAGLVAIAWSLIALAVGGAVGSALGLALAFVGAPLALFWCVAGRVTLALAVGCAILATGFPAALKLGWLPPPPLVENEVWMGVGLAAGVGGLAVAWLRRSLKGRELPTGAALLLTVWWSCWAVGFASVFPLPKPNTVQDRCAANLKAIGLALRASEGDASAPGLDQLVASGRLDHAAASCPLGTSYIPVGEFPCVLPKAEQPAYLCANHPGALIYVSRAGVVHACVPAKLSPSRKAPWWLRAWPARSGPVGEHRAADMPEEGAH